MASLECAVNNNSLQLIELGDLPFILQLDIKAVIWPALCTVSMRAALLWSHLGLLMCLTLSPCKLAGSRSVSISLWIFIYLLCSVFTSFVTVPCKTISLGGPGVAGVSWAQLTRSIMKPSDSSCKQNLSAGAWIEKTLRHRVRCVAKRSAAWAGVYWGVNAESLGIGPRTHVMMSESKETGRKKQQQKAHFRLLNSWLGKHCFQSLGSSPRSLLSRESRKQPDLRSKQTYLFFPSPVLSNNRCL